MEGRREGRKEGRKRGRKRRGKKEGQKKRKRRREVGTQYMYTTKEKESIANLINTCCTFHHMILCH